MRYRVMTCRDPTCGEESPEAFYRVVDAACENSGKSGSAIHAPLRARRPRSRRALVVIPPPRPLPRRPLRVQPIREMVRVVRPDGRVVAVEPDSEVLLLDSGLIDITRRILAFRAAGYASPWSGRSLRGLRGAGLDDVRMEVRPSKVPSLELAQERLHLLGVARAAAAHCVVTAREAGAWEADLAARDRRGVFTCILLMVVAAGRVPLGREWRILAVIATSGLEESTGVLERLDRV